MLKKQKKKKKKESLVKNVGKENRCERETWSYHFLRLILLYVCSLINGVSVV